MRETASGQWVLFDGAANHMPWLRLAQSILPEAPASGVMVQRGVFLLSLSLALIGRHEDCVTALRRLLESMPDKPQE
jgi:hypothetical protein